LYLAVEVGIGGFVHVILGPFLEPYRFDSLASVAAEFIAIEIVAGPHLDEPVDLFAHQIKKL
jgi:hypothetical protein